MLFNDCGEVGILNYFCIGVLVVIDVDLGRVGERLEESCSCGFYYFSNPAVLALDCINKNIYIYNIRRRENVNNYFYMYKVYKYIY